jgi:uncharacterized protein
VILTLYNRTIHQAVATSSGLGVLISIPAAIGYAAIGWPHMAHLPPGSLGYVSLIGFVLIAPVAAWTAPLGARIAHRFSKRRLETVFGVYQVLIALRFLTAAL